MGSDLGYHPSDGVCEPDDVCENQLNKKNILPNDLLSGTGSDLPTNYRLLVQASFPGLTTGGLV